jgi:hypothetical protein
MSCLRGVPRRLAVGRSGLQARRRSARSIGTVAAILAASVALAQTDTSAALQPAVKPHTVTVGEPLVYSVDVPLAPDERVAGPGPDADFTPWEVRDYGEERVEDGARLTYQLVAFETGEQKIPAIEVRVEDPDGKTRVLNTKEARAEVASVLEEGDEQPADIRGPMALREEPLAVLLRVLAIALVVGVVAAGIGLLWRRTRSKAVGEQEAPDPPDVAALKALRQLKDARLPEQGETKQHYTILSDVLRAYLAGRYGIRTLEETTSAIVAGLRATGDAAEYVVRFEDLLRESDLVKFAKARPAAPACYSAVEASADLVRETAAPVLSATEESADDLR